MQHYLIDCFLQDSLGGALPLYDTSMSDVFVMNGSGKAELRFKQNRVCVPLHETETWVWSHRIPATTQAMLETFINSCLSMMTPHRINKVSDIIYVGPESHILAGRDTKNLGLESMLFERRIVYLNSIPSRSIIVLPEPSSCAVLPNKDIVEDGKRVARMIGAMLIAPAIEYYSLMR